MNNLCAEDFEIINDVICCNGKEVSEQEVLDILQAALSPQQAQGEAERQIVEDYIRCLSLLGVPMPVGEDIPNCLSEMVDELITPVELSAAPAPAAVPEPIAYVRTLGGAIDWDENCLFPDKQSARDDLTERQNADPGAVTEGYDITALIAASSPAEPEGYDSALQKIAAGCTSRQIPGGTKVNTLTRTEMQLIAAQALGSRGPIKPLESPSDEVDMRQQAQGELPPVPYDEHERQICEELEARDYWHDKATELAERVGEYFGFDVGEHSNLNCPVQTALDADWPAPAAVPEGWALVPVEPTRHQVHAAEFPIDDVVSMRQSSQHSIARAAYKAMLAAAPTPAESAQLPPVPEIMRRWFLDQEEVALLHEMTERESQDSFPELELFYGKAKGDDGSISHGLLLSYVECPEEGVIPISVQPGEGPGLQQEQRLLRYTFDGALAECPCCGSLDVGAVGSVAHCYGCGLSITKRSHKEALAAWNRRTRSTAPSPAEPYDPCATVDGLPKVGQTIEFSRLDSNFWSAGNVIGYHGKWIWILSMGLPNSWAIDTMQFRPPSSEEQQSEGSA